LVLFTAFLTLNAQEIEVPSGYELADSLVYIRTGVEDASLSGKNVFNVMPSKMKGDRSDVKVRQTRSVENAMASHIASNESRALTGYRVRIYFDNKQNSRSASESALARFESEHHDIAAYRSFENPYFRVTVGDFRTKSEAMKFLQEIKGEYPSAVLVKEKISYPVIDKENAYVVDTVKVLRPVKF